MIQPTVGRLLHFYPGPHERNAGTQLVAIICHVWNDRMINVAVFDPNGKPWVGNTTSIQLVQPEDQEPEGSSYCAWMPYQYRKEHGSESGEKTAGSQSI